MSLAFSGPRGSFEIRWIVYALLRDNVQHYLEGGKPSASFTTVHQIAEALGGREVNVNAQQLHTEIARAQQALLNRPTSELAISARTRSVLTLNWPPPAERQTLLLRDTQLLLPVTDDTDTFDDIFGALVRELLEITSEASESDVVSIRDL